jgi:tight adherence protein B
MTPFLWTLATAIAVAAVISVVLLILRGVVEAVQSLRLRQQLQAAQESAPGEQILLPPPPIGWRERMDKAFEIMVQRSGAGMSPAQALGLTCLVGVLLGGGLYLWREETWMAAAGLALGMLLPFSVFAILQSRWRIQLQEQLPDAYFLLARSLRAGMSLEQALAGVAQHGAKPLADEFHRVSEQCKLGLNVPAALQQMADRLRMPDVDALLSVITLHRTLGGNLPALLDRLAASTRDRIQFRGYFRAATALGRITGIALAAIAPVLFIGYLIWQPDYLANFAASPIGLNALGMALALEVLGVLWLWYLLRVD